MKKILSAVLILCMLASSCLLLTSCGEKNGKDADVGMVETLSAAFKNTLLAFFGDDAGTGGILKSAGQKGAVNIQLKSDTLMGGDLTEIDETLYMDEKNSAYVLDTKLVYDGHKYKATLWADKNGLTFEGASILGSDDVLSLDFDSFVKYFSESALFDHLYADFGVSDEDAARIVNAVEQLRGVIDESQTVMSEGEIDKLAKKIGSVFHQVIDMEQIEDENGDEINVLTLTYKVDNEKIAAARRLVLEATLDKGQTDGTDTPEALRTALEEEISAFDAMLNVEADVFIYIDLRNGTISEMRLRTDIEPLTDALEELTDTLQLDLTWCFGADEISLSGKGKMGNTRYTLDAGVVKEQTGSRVNYSAWAYVKNGNVRIDILDASCAYNKKSGVLTLEGVLALNEYESVEFDAEATYKANKNEVVFELIAANITAANESVLAFGEEDTFRITIQPTKEIPRVETDATDIVRMDEDEVKDLFESISGSVIGKKILGILAEKLA